MILLGDWGTSKLRLYSVENGAVTGRREGPGIGAITGSVADALRATIGDWTPQALVLAGMVGSRNGLVEVPYASCPADASEWRAVAHRDSFDGIPLTVAAGLALTGERPDVMRGEETQIFGAAPSGRGLVALPGTHSKWALVEDGRIVSFRTWFTGELFALLQQSTLTRVDGPGSGEGGFEAGLARATGDLLGSLFEARAAQLVAGKPRAWAVEYLSGLLIGEEVRAAIVEWRPEHVTLIGDPALLERYTKALAAQGVPAATHDGEAAVLAGLKLLED